ncbi:hypothetical protein FRB94_003645 [Tulasnella sp. JGI-2019a]|nr:hypothetical protein FRB94_003645 [Tulasnella sp. JGI-2019a]
MAPTKRRNGGKKPTKVTQVPPSHPPEHYVQGADALIAQSEYPLAQQTLLNGLKIFPVHAEMSLLLGVVEMELGNFAAARQVLNTLIPPSTSAPSPPSLDAYFYLGQLHEDPRAALGLYQSGVELVVKTLKGKGPALAGPDVSEDHLKKKAVKALTAMVSIWMTDLCFEPEAEQQCETLLSHAQELDPDNPEVLRTLASVRISQQRNDEARVLVERSWVGWKDLEPGDINAPSTDDRLALAKLFLELEVYASSLAVIQSVLADNDQEAEAWYLQGLGYWEISNAVAAGKAVVGVKEMTWREIMQVARNCLGTCKELLEGQNHLDDELRQQTADLILEMEKQGFHYTIDPDAQLEAQMNMLEAAREGGDDEDWEDVDEGFEGIEDDEVSANQTGDVEMS